MKYRVSVPVKGFMFYEVEADSPEQAKEKVLEGVDGGDEVKEQDIKQDEDSNNYEVHRMAHRVFIPFQGVTKELQDKGADYARRVFFTYSSVEKRFAVYIDSNTGDVKDMREEDWKITTKKGKVFVGQVEYK